MAFETKKSVQSVWTYEPDYNKSGFMMADSEASLKQSEMGKKYEDSCPNKNNDNQFYI